MKQFNCEEMKALTVEEMANIDGGDLFKAAQSFIKKSIWGIAITAVINNWDDIKKGLADGWEAGGK